MKQSVEAETEICRAILTDLKFNEKSRILRELIDEIGLYTTAFTSPALANFYQAAVKCYTRSAPRSESPKFSDVIIELEGMSDKNIDLWKKKYSDKENERHAYDVSARLLMNYYLGKEVEPLVREWVGKLSQSDSVKEDIASLISLLVNLATDGTMESRPSNILEKAWAAGIRDPEPTGFDALNREWDGGWRPKWLVAIACPSSHGKSSSAVSFMCERVRQGRYTLFNSFEQSSEELLFKSLCNLSGVLTLDQVEHPDRIRTDMEWQALQSSKVLLDKYVRMYDASCKIEELPMRVRRHQAEFGQGMDFTIIDHIGIVDKTRNSNAAAWSQGLEQSAYFLKNDVSKRYNVCTLLYSQVPPDVDKQLRANNFTTNDAMRGSSGIKNAVDVLTIGCRHNGKIKSGESFVYDEPRFRNVMVLQTTKLRRDGKQSWIGLRYDPSHHRLLNEEVQLQ